MSDIAEPGEQSFQFSLAKDELLSLLEKVIAVVPARDVLPVLRNVLVEVSPEHIRVTATSLEMTIVVSSSLVVSTATGAVLLPARRFIEMLREASEGDVVLSVTGESATVAVGAATWTLQLQPVNDYPATPDDDDVAYTKVDRALFVQRLTAVRKSATKDTAQPSLMMIDVKKNRARASDGVRFQQVMMPDVPDIQIPIQAVPDLLKLCRASESSDLLIGQDETSLRFRVDDDRFITQKATATFPNVDAGLLAPVLTNDMILTADRVEFIRAIRRVRITADPDTAAIRLKLSDGQMEILSHAKDGSSAREVMEVAWTCGDKTLTFNHAYLTELLACMESDNVLIKLGKDTSPSKPQSMLLIDDAQEMLSVLSQLRIDGV